MFFSNLVGEKFFEIRNVVEELIMKGRIVLGMLGLLGIVFV